MSVLDGLGSQLMYATETTYGTFATPTRSTEFVDDSMKLTVERIDSKGIRAGRRLVSNFLPGKRSAAGDVNTEFSAVGMGLLLQHCMGSGVVTGSNPTYTQTFTIGDLPVGFTMQLGRQDLLGTVDPFTYLGCRVTSWELSIKAGELLMLKPSIVAQDETTAQALATFSDPSVQLLSYAGGTVTAGGTQVDLADFTLKGDNKLDAARFRVRGAATPAQSLENSWREYTGTLTADFNSLTQYNHYVNADQLSLVATFQGSAIPSGAGSHYTLVVTANVRYNGETPVVPGPSLLSQTIPFSVVGLTTDAASISLVLTTSDSAV